MHEKLTWMQYVCKHSIPTGKNTANDYENSLNSTENEFS